MQPLFETLAVTILAFLGLFIGLWIGQVRKRWWALGYAFPLALVVLVAFGRNIDRLRFVLPFSLVLAGRYEYIVLGFVVPMVLGTLIPRVDGLRIKILLGILLGIATIYGVVCPFFVPFLIRGRLEKLDTAMTLSGVCLQTTNYTCGPAAAVTALARFGIKAEEGEMAILAHTTPKTGTPDDLLAQAIEKRYGREGIRCTYRRFDSIEQLKGICPMIAVVKFAFFVDHYVTVLEVDDEKVLIGDPINGKEELTYDQFRDRWRSTGIVVARQ